MFSLLVSGMTICNPSVWDTSESGIGMVSISSLLTHMVYLLPFFSYLAGAQRVSDRPSDCPQPVRPGYDYKYRSRSYRFAERQKLLSASGMNNVAFRIAKLNGGLLLSKLERFMLFDKALAFWGAGHL